MLGLVLSGGRSARMGRDKGALVYADGLDQRARGALMLARFCAGVYVSCRAEQGRVTDLPVILDTVEGEGPGAGILSAARAHPGASWLVLACDFPYITDVDLAALVAGRALAATCFVHPDGAREPLCAIWEPPALAALERGFGEGRYAPRAALAAVRVRELAPPDPARLRNVNVLDDALGIGK